MARIDYPEGILSALEELNPSKITYIITFFPRIFRTDPKRIKEVKIFAYFGDSTEIFISSWRLYECEDWNKTVEMTHKELSRMVELLVKKFNAQRLSHPNWSCIFT